MVFSSRYHSKDDCRFNVDKHLLALIGVVFVMESIWLLIIGRTASRRNIKRLLYFKVSDQPHCLRHAGLELIHLVLQCLKRQFQNFLSFHCQASKLSDFLDPYLFSGQGTLLTPGEAIASSPLISEAFALSSTAGEACSSSSMGGQDRYSSATSF